MTAPRYRILHVAARLTRGGRRLRICATWPWRNELATAFHRPAALPRPAWLTTHPVPPAHDPRNPESPTTATGLHHAQKPRTSPPTTS
ncbi:hypothetical protein PUR32_05590 [Streptomyces sp. BE133]|nr:hypothetical protein [Streptomyces sp. BE133]